MKPEWLALTGFVAAAVAVALIVGDQHISSHKLAGGDTYSSEHPTSSARPHDVGRPRKSNRTPASLSDLPPLLKNLELINLTNEPALLVFTSDNLIGEPEPESIFKFRCQLVQNNRQVNVNSEFLQVERNIFTEGPFQDCFSLRRIERRVGKNPRNGLEETNTFAIIEDRSPAKNGETHPIKKGSRNGKIIRYNTATFRLNIPGERNNEMKVVDGQSFSLPFGSEPQRCFKFTGVDADGKAVIEYKGASERVGRFYLSPLSAEQRLAQQGVEPDAGHAPE